MNRHPGYGLVVSAALALIGGCDSFGAKQAAYDSPDQAGEALIAAVRSGETSEMLRVLGEAAQPVVESGDAVDDANTRSEFLAAYGAAHRWVNQTPEIATLWCGTIAVTARILPSSRAVPGHRANRGQGSRPVTNSAASPGERCRSQPTIPGNETSPICQ